MMHVSGAVEENVDGADAVRQRPNGVRGADIERVQFAGQSFELRGIQIRRDDAAALAGKSDSGGAANTSPGRRDECGLSL